MKYLPVGLDIRASKCVVVGGGRIGARKVRNLLRAGGDVTLVSPDAISEMAEMASSGRIQWKKEAFREGHLDGAFLAVVATDDEELNARIADAAVRLGILICDASSGDRSQLIFGALHEEDGVTIAVFTDGQNPALARETRDRIARIGPGEEG